MQLCSQKTNNQIKTSIAHTLPFKINLFINKYCSFKCSFHQIIQKQKSPFPQKYLFIYLFTVIIGRSFSLAPNQHIRMISEGSRDSGYWSNDCFSSTIAYINYILKYIKKDPKHLNDILVLVFKNWRTTQIIFYGCLWLSCIILTFI